MARPKNELNILQSSLLSFYWLGSKGHSYHFLSSVFLRSIGITYRCDMIAETPTGLLFRSCLLRGLDFTTSWRRTFERNLRVARSLCTTCVSCGFTTSGLLSWLCSCVFQLSGTSSSTWCLVFHRISAFLWSFGSRLGALMIEDYWRPLVVTHGSDFCSVVDYGHSIEPILLKELWRKIFRRPRRAQSPNQGGAFLHRSTGY